MIKQISFDNYKCLSEKKFDLSNFNLFTGYNGRGKSSVIQALLMLSQSVQKDNINSIYHLHLNGVFVQLGDFIELMTDPDRADMSIGFSMILSEEKDYKVNLLYAMSNDFKVGKLIKCDIDGTDYFDSSSTLTSSESIVITNQSQRSLRALPQFMYKHFWSQNIHFVSANRIGPIKFVEVKEKPDFHTVGVNGALTINTLYAYGEKVDSSMNVDVNDHQQHSLEEASAAWLNYIMNGGEVSVMYEGSKGQRSPILQLEFSFGSGRDYKPYNVGFGYSYILSIIVTALIAKDGSIVIVENPEAHLHPEAQVRLTYLLAKLAARGVQVFVESHSEHVVNAIRLATLKKDFKLQHSDVKLFFFDSDYTKKDLLIERDGRIKNWPSHFFDQYQHELAEIMTLGANRNEG